MKLRQFLLALLAVAVLAPGCGSLPTGKVPVDSEIKPWQPPDEDELLADEDDDDWDLDEDEGEDADEPVEEGDAGGGDPCGGDDAAEAGEKAVKTAPAPAAKKPGAKSKKTPKKAN